MKKAQRTDAHRPGAIIPANYEQRVGYSLPSGMVPAIAVDCTMPVPTYDHEGRSTGYITNTCPDSGWCCVRSCERKARATGGAVFGATGKCGVCGAHFTYGVLFTHAPSGDVVHMGHDCADKYEAMYGLSAWELANNRTRAAVAKAIARSENEKARAEFLAENPGMTEALALGDATSEHKGRRILADMAGKLVTYKSLTEKQVAFCLKLAHEISNPAPAKPEELHVTAPTGKGVEFTGEIVSVKLHESAGFGYGRDTVYTWKCTIKVQTEAGSWLAWGTIPSSLIDMAYEAGIVGQDNMRTYLGGLSVTVKATLERPAARDTSEIETDALRARIEARNAETHFVFMRRPSMSIAGVVNHPVQRKTRTKKEQSNE